MVCSQISITRFEDGSRIGRPRSLFLHRPWGHPTACHEWNGGVSWQLRQETTARAGVSPFGKSPVICLQSPQSTGDFRPNHASRPPERGNAIFRSLMTATDWGIEAVFGSLEMNLSRGTAAAAPDRGNAYAEIDEFAVGDDCAGKQLAMPLAGQLGDHPAPCGLRRRGKIDAHPWGLKSGYISHGGFDFNLRKEI